jgi:glycerol-3-phosphate dehydrogenase
MDTYGQTTGAEVIDLVDHDTLKVNAKQIVNTTGRWQSEYPEANTWCRLSKGIHLVLPKVLNDHALLLTAKSDGRVFFIIPWYGLSLLGTTDTHYSGDINQLNIEQQEIDYLLNEANHYLPHVNWQEKDILGQFAGLRVLRQSDDTSPSSVSRDWELKTLPNGLHLSIGGKITSAREDASKIVDIVTSNLGLMEDCKTRNKAFPWKPAIPYSDWLTMTIQQGLQLGIDFESLHWLIRRHGNRVTKVFALVEHEPSLNKRLLPCLPFILADFTFCVQHEMVVHLEDILRRRIPLVILAKISLPELRQMAKLTGDIMNWTHSRIESELEHCRKQWPTTKSRD